MYCSHNFRTKKALKEAVKAAADGAGGLDLTIFQPGPFEGNEPDNGTVTLEGPHYPEPHKWYARATVKDGQIVKVL